jgi:hypothetical protein
VMGVITIQAFRDELLKIATSIPGLSTGEGPTASVALGKLRNGGMRPPKVPKIGVSVPKVKIG